MNIIHSTFSTRGGAGVVADRINRSLNDLGHNSVLQFQTSSDLRDQPFRSPLTTFAAAVDELVVSKSNNPVLFSNYRNRLGYFDKETIHLDTIYNLHWINGIYTLAGLKRLVSESNRSVYWTIHDMYPFTAGCHHAMGCNQFESSCSSCPQVKAIFRNSVRDSMAAKIEMRGVYEQIKFIAPSNWIKKSARESYLLRNSEIEVIPNPVSKELAIFSLSLGNQEVHSKEKKFRFVIVANNLSDPNKQVGFTLSALQGIQNCSVSLIGNNGESYAQKYKDFVKWLGPLDDRSMADAFSQNDALLVMSIAENAPLVISEAGIIGVPTIVMKGNGADEMVDDGVNGFIVSDFKSLRSLANQLIQQPEKLLKMKEKTRKSAFEKYSPEFVAKKYLSFYDA